MRTDRPPFNDKRVRQAMSMAINRAAIREALTKGEGVYDQAVWVGLAGWASPVSDLGPAAKYWEYDPQAAKQLLQAAGAERIETTWNHADASVYQQSYVDVAALTQAQWREVGITARDNQQPYAQYIGTTYRGEYEGVAHRAPPTPYWIDYLSELFSWSPGAGRGRINLSYVNDPRINQLLDKQRGQFNESERKATVREIQLLCAEEQWQIYFSTEPRTYFWSPNIENFRPSSFFPLTHLMKVWRDQ
jgi:peptide/nickel transport system substrate-binding protein